MRLGRAALALLVAVSITGCGTADAPSETATSATTGTSSPAPASPTTTVTDEPTATVTAGPTASLVVGACLDEEVIDAVDQVRTGDLDTDPPIGEVADALETLELEGRPDEIRERLVSTLRASPTVQDDIVFAAVAFWAEVPVVEC
ncbi:MAG: hypothetical protein ABR593_10955 [Candidatus Limnocylindria bacterium]